MIEKKYYRYMEYGNYVKDDGDGGEYMLLDTPGDTGDVKAVRLENLSGYELCSGRLSELGPEEREEAEKCAKALEGMTENVNMHSCSSTDKVKFARVGDPWAIDLEAPNFSRVTSGGATWVAVYLDASHFWMISERSGAARCFHCSQFAETLEHNGMPQITVLGKRPAGKTPGSVRVRGETRAKKFFSD